SASIILLAAAAWIALGLMGASMHHEVSGVHAHHHGMPAKPPPLQMTLFVTSWMVMTIAMMLPTTLPVLATLHTLAVERSDPLFLVTLVVVGYLMTWAVFGGLIQLLQMALQRIAVVKGLLDARLADGLILLLAGAYQFTSLKYKCLEKCRSPLSFVLEHWRGPGERWAGFWLGGVHGVVLGGCWWALEVLLFVVGLCMSHWVLGCVYA